MSNNRGLKNRVAISNAFAAYAKYMNILLGNEKKA